MPLKVTIDEAPHPLTDDGRRRETLVIPDGATIAEIVDGRTEFHHMDVEVLLNGTELVSLDRGLVAGDVVSLRPRVRGGLGRVIGTLALVAAAIYFPPALGFTGITAALVGAAITVGGGLILNALFPVRPPDIGGLSGPAQNPEAAQIFSLTGGQNRARAYGPLPLVLGRHRMFPDLGSQGYTENEGDDQYWQAIYHFGLGDLAVTEIRNGATLLSDYAGVTTELSGIDGAIDLVAGNVDTAQGAALTDTNWVSRQTGARTDRIGVDFVGRIFEQNARTGAYEAHSVSVQVRFSKQGTPASTRTYTLTHDDSGVYRRSIAIDLPSAGTWTIEVRRRTAPQTADNRIHDDVEFAALRSYQPDDADYTGQTRLGVRIRASGQINGRLDRLSAIVQQRVPVWAGGAWAQANAATSNPAALFRWFARGIRVGGRPVAGAGLADGRIDHEGLGRWFAWCDTRGYRCDLVIQSAMTMQAVLELISQCGRASISWKTGKLGVVFEDETETPAGMVTPGNIVKGSFAVQWNDEPPADEIVVRYIEPDMDWGWNSVRRNRPGLSGTPQSTATTTAQGIIDRTHAAVECNLQAARQHYHRRRFLWEMGREGRAFAKGDVVWITHSLIDAGIAGRLAGIAGRLLTLDRDVDVSEDGGWILLRLADGELFQAEISQPDGPGARVRLATALPSTPEVLPDALYRLYDQAEPPLKARIIGVRPQSATRFWFTAIDEVAAYHQAATSDLDVTFPDPRDQTPRVVSVIFSARTIRIDNAEMTELQAALTVSGQWAGAVVRAGAPGAQKRRVDILAGPDDLVATWLVPLATQQQIEIVPGMPGTPDGPAWIGTWTPAPEAAPPAPTGLTVTELADGTRSITLTPPTWPNLAGVRVRYHAVAGTAWADMTPLHEGLVTVWPLEIFEPPAGTYQFAARAETTRGVQSAVVRVSATVGAVRERPGAGEEEVWAITDAETETLPAALRPSNDWGYRQPGTASSLPGAAGEDGATEYVYTTLPKTSDGSPPSAITGAANLPLATWDYDEPLLAAGIVRGSHTYWDGIPPDLGPDRPWLVRFHRTPSGSPSPGDDVGSVAWTQEAPRKEDSFEYLRWLNYQPDTPRDGALWRVTRALEGRPENGDAVAADFGAAVLVTVSRPRTWTLLARRAQTINSRSPGEDYELNDGVDAARYDLLAIYGRAFSRLDGIGGFFTVPASTDWRAASVASASTTTTELSVRIKAGSPDTLQMHRGAAQDVFVVEVWGIVN